MDMTALKRRKRQIKRPVDRKYVIRFLPPVFIQYLFSPLYFPITEFIWVFASLMEDSSGTITYTL